MNKEDLKQKHLQFLLEVAKVLNISERNIRNVEVAALGNYRTTDEKVLVIDTLNGRTWLRHTTFFNMYYLDLFERGRVLLEKENPSVKDIVKFIQENTTKKVVT